MTKGTKEHDDFRLGYQTGVDDARYVWYVVSAVISIGAFVTGLLIGTLFL